MLTTIDSFQAMYRTVHTIKVVHVISHSSTVMLGIHVECLLIERVGIAPSMFPVGNGVRRFCRIEVLPDSPSLGLKAHGGGGGIAADSVASATWFIHVQPQTIHWDLINKGSYLWWGQKSGHIFAQTTSCEC